VVWQQPMFAVPFVRGGVSWNMLSLAIDPLTIQMWWGAIALGGLLCAAAGVRLVRPEWLGSRGWRLAWLLAWAVVVAMAALDGVFHLVDLPPSGWAGPVQLGVLVMAGVSQLGLAAAAHRPGRKPVALALAAAALLTGWLAWRSWELDEIIRSPLPDPIIEQQFLREHFPRGAIETAPPDERYNCHDFTFFGGPATGAKRHPEELLIEQGFRPVDVPSVGDIIIYRERNGAIMHSGIVKAVGVGGFILIESKWGGRGRYLHQPEVQGMDAIISYYSNKRE
jgi:hypothetical protein